MDFYNKRCVLVHGSTGSGKSTLLDIPMWCLFGLTAKDGAADEVRTWASKAPTSGILQIAIRDTKYTIIRTRGKSSQNDLYWLVEGSEEKHRGKDITETQSLLNDLLGLSPFMYTVGAYYNEFSPTGTFFTAKAAERRELMEALANLTLPTILADKISDKKREITQELSDLSVKTSKVLGRIDQLERAEASCQRDAERWEEKQKREIKELQGRSDMFITEKTAKIMAVKSALKNHDDKIAKDIMILEESLHGLLLKCTQTPALCAECNQPNGAHTKAKFQVASIEAEIKYYKTTQNPHIVSLMTLEAQENHYVERLTVEMNRVNPFLGITEDNKIELKSQKQQLVTYETQSSSVAYKLQSLELLQKLIVQLRSELLLSTVKLLESEVNSYLEKYFDSEIRVGFTVTSGDKIDVLVWKGGNECTYKQLSKGQRSLLKLCFAVSAMKACSNRSGVHFDTLGFDESMDGLDTALKLKAFNLFTELSLNHSTVLVIDHSTDLQALFDKKIRVSMINDESIMYES